MRKEAKAGLSITTKRSAAFCIFTILGTLFFLFCLPAAGHGQGITLLSDSVMSQITGGFKHPFAVDPVIVRIENNRRATVPADDFYWGDLDGVSGAKNSGFIVESMPDTNYSLSFPNLYMTATGYEYVPSDIPPATKTQFPYAYAPTEVDRNIFFANDVAVSRFSPTGGQKQFVDHGWGAIVEWVDTTKASGINWNGHQLVPPNTAFLATAISTMEIASPQISMTVSVVPEGPPGPARCELCKEKHRPDLTAAHKTQNRLGTLCIENLKVRVEGGITGPNSTVKKVIIVYPNF